MQTGHLSSTYVRNAFANFTWLFVPIQECHSSQTPSMTSAMWAYIEASYKELQAVDQQQRTLSMRRKDEEEEEFDVSVCIKCGGDRFFIADKCKDCGCVMHHDDIEEIEEKSVYTSDGSNDVKTFFEAAI